MAARGGGREPADVVALAHEVRALRTELAELRAHVSHIGYLVQVVEARGRRKPLISPQVKIRVRAQLLRWSWPVRRGLSLAAHPRRSFGHLSAIYRDAMKTSFRAHPAAGRWRHSLKIDLLSHSVVDQVSRRVLGRRPAIYTVKQAQKTISGPRPRILHAIPNVFVGGSTQLIVDLHDYLGHKYNMHVMTSAAPQGASHQGIVVHNFREPTSVAAMVDLMRKFDPQLLHVHYWGDVDTQWYAKVFEAAGQVGIPVVLNINTPVEPYGDPGVVECVYVSDYVRKQFGGIYERETVIHPGIDLERFLPPTHRDPHAANSIGMVYRLEQDKLDMNSIEVLIEVVKRRPTTRAIVVGGGSLFDAYVARTAAEGVRGNFDFTGYVPYGTLNDYYAKFSVFVAPVWKESFGQVTPFAMAMGLAVAGNKVGALPEILGSDATLGSSVGETADKIVALLDDPDRTRLLGERNREICLSKYAVTVMCARYDEVYRRVLGEPAYDAMPGFPPAEIFLPA